MEAGDPDLSKIKQEPPFNSDHPNLVEESVFGDQIIRIKSEYQHVDEVEGKDNAGIGGKRSRRTGCVKVNYKDESSEYKPNMRTKKNAKKQRIEDDECYSPGDESDTESESDREVENLRRPRRKVPLQTYSSDSDSVLFDDEDMDRHFQGNNMGK